MKRNELLLLALRGEIPWNEAARLNGKPEAVVYIKPSDLLPMFQRYIDGKIDGDFPASLRDTRERMCRGRS